MSEQQTMITGEVIHVGEVETFGGGFTKCVVVVKTGDKYPQEIPVEFVKEKADEAHLGLRVGMQVEVAYNLRGREWNGRWFASVQGWKFKVVSGAEPESDQDDLPMNDDDENQPF